MVSERSGNVKLVKTWKNRKKVENPRFWDTGPHLESRSTPPRTVVPAPQGMEAPQAIEPPMGTGEGVGTAVVIGSCTSVYSATTRYFPVRRASVAYLVVCYNPFIGRGKA